MSAADAAVGIMDGAYFVGRKELLEFFNELLDVKLEKIEQTATGAIACQVTDLIFPGSIPMSRVNWEAKSDYEFVQNYKLLQAAFTKHRVQKYVDVDKLIRAKYQDNLEFCQWLKAFYDQAAAPRAEEYDPAAVRAKGKGGKKFNQLHGSTSGGNSSSSGAAARRGGGGSTISSSSSANKSRFSSAPPSNSNSGSAAITTRPTARSAPSTTTTTTARSNNSNNNNNNGTTSSAAWQAEQAQFLEKISYLESTLEEVERERDQIVMDVEKERDFYFGKLRSIEVMLQVHQEEQQQPPAAEVADAETTMQHLVDRMFQILYATAEDNLTVNAQGEVVDAATLEDIEEEGEAAQSTSAAGADESAESLLAAALNDQNDDDDGEPEEHLENHHDNVKNDDDDDAF
ncbi:hypothetical protein ACA910_001422 [Epithemia clementina (nom. ined.)]